MLLIENVRIMNLGSEVYPIRDVLQFPLSGGFDQILSLDILVDQSYVAVSITT